MRPATTILFVATVATLACGATSAWSEELPEPGFLMAFGELGEEPGQFVRPRCIAVGSNGYVYVTEPELHRVQKFDLQGAFVSTWGAKGAAEGQFDLPWGIAVDGQSNVFVVGTTNKRIQKFDEDGGFLMEFGQGGMGDSILMSPWGIACYDGFVYVTEPLQNRVVKFSTQGVFIKAWGGLGDQPGEFKGPIGITANALGVFVGDGEFTGQQENPRIQRFTPEGVYVDGWGGDWSFAPPSGLSTDGAARIYVATRAGHSVELRSTSGELESRWGTVGSGEGQFANPSDIAVSSDGRIYVVDTSNHRVQVFAFHTAVRATSWTTVRSRYR